MSQSFAVDNSNDLFLGPSGNLELSTDIESVLNVCKNAVQTILGEMKYQTNVGMPNFETIWKSQPNIKQFRAALISTLKFVENVIGVGEPIIIVENNVLNYSITISTSFGEEVLTNV